MATAECASASLVSTDPGYLIFGGSVAVAAAILLALHPARDEILHPARRPSAPLALIALAGAIPLVWFGFSLAATLLQAALDGLGLLSETMAASNRALAGSVLVAASLYQWTPLKNACLAHCRSPIEFLVRHWRNGSFGAVVSGVRHGLFCLGCCWMLMALLFVGGLMNLAWIAAIAMLVLIEKTLPWGGRMGLITGLVLVGWGGSVLLPMS